MGHQNTKRHKANHGGYKHKPSKKEVQANLDYWAGLKSDKEVEVELVDDELDALFNKSTEKLVEIGTQLKLF